MSRAEFQKGLDKLITAAEVRRALGISTMTLHIWRRRRGLPTVVIPGEGRNTIRFLPDEVADWAKQNGEKFRNRVRRSA
jgi:hypothetical protein